MDITTIGKEIAALRKEQGLKQEDVAKQVGVSPQAVSKWENGSMPDTELLPKIADVFGVSIDRLFGRSLGDYNDLKSALIKKIKETEREEQFKEAFEYCWSIEKALFGMSVDASKTVKEYEQELPQDGQRYSSILADEGFTRMGLANRLQYFLIVPEMKDTDKAFFKDVDYTEFFKDFSNQDVFDVCVMLHKRENNKAFTTGLLEKTMKISRERALEIIEILKKYQMISVSQLEVDDDIQVIYSFCPRSSFIALLIFAREVIKNPNQFDFYSGRRSKPYLQ